VRYTPVRCIPMRYMPMRCTPVRYTPVLGVTDCAVSVRTGVEASQYGCGGKVSQMGASRGNMKI